MNRRSVDTAPDPDLLKVATYNVFLLKQGELLSAMVHLGRELGLFQQLDASVHTITSLANATGTQQRWVEEWLYATSAAGLVVHEAGEFWLTPEMAVLLARPDVPTYVAGMFSSPVEVSILRRLEEAFRTGIGFAWDDHGEATCNMQDQLSAGKQKNLLVPVVLGGVVGLTDRLEAGAAVYDIGCGAGTAAMTIAEAFPASTVVGIDPSDHAIAAAMARAEAMGLSNVTFQKGTFEDLPADGVDVLITLDVLHDLPDPVSAIGLASRAVRSDGVWLVADIRCGETFEENARLPLLPMFYSMSVVYCMNSALSAPGGMGLGTMGLHPERLRGWVEGVGMDLVAIHQYDHDLANQYYEIRPQ